MNNILQKYSAQISKSLEIAVPSCDIRQSVVHDAMRYSLSAGGKRIRPVLVYEFCKLYGGDVNKAKAVAIAIEMIHTYSLIHDDLPCMDNDDMRRGMPSCHIKFGEDYALLAGDALLTEAFKVISSSELAKEEPVKAIKCIQILSECAGISGMVGGQTIDIANEGQTVTVDDLVLMDSKKTGALISAACQMGVVIAGGSDSDIERAKCYADNIGLAFQIVDDILDVTADEKQLGKPVGSDKDNNKSTYVTLLGLEESQKISADLTSKAIDALSVYGEKADFLINLAKYLANRNK